MDKVHPDGGGQGSAAAEHAAAEDPLEPWSTKDIKSINNILDSSDRD